MGDSMLSSSPTIRREPTCFSMRAWAASSTAPASSQSPHGSRCSSAILFWMGIQIAGWRPKKAAFVPKRGGALVRNTSAKRGGGCWRSFPAAASHGFRTTTVSGLPGWSIYAPAMQTTDKQSFRKASRGNCRLFLSITDICLAVPKENSGYTFRHLATLIRASIKEYRRIIC